MCIFTLKHTLQCYNGNRSPVRTCFLDVSKAFDRVNHWTRKKLCDRNVPNAYTRVLMVWYTTKKFCIKWGGGGGEGREYLKCLYCR